MFALHIWDLDCEAEALPEVAMASSCPAPCYLMALQVQLERARGIARGFLVDTPINLHSQKWL